MTAFYLILKTKTSTCLLLLLIISLIFRLIRLGNPFQYVFDEVYHVVTARGYSNNDSAAYEYWQQSPEPDTAYDWLHPPLAKLIQAGSIKLFGDHSFTWRLPSAVFGTIAIAAVYFLGLELFKNKVLALLSASIFSFDGLQLTMSRITMNDIFVTTWIIIAVTFFYKYLNLSLSKGSSFLLLTGLFTGLGLATKWSALLLYPLFVVFLFSRLKSILKNPRLLFFTIYCLILIPAFIYLLSYLQFFTQGHSFADFYHLHQQIYWYQTGLTASHHYQSTAWQWPLLIRPVWFYVDYTSTTIANIYNLGNPAIFWGGLMAIGYVISRQISLKLYSLTYLLSGYLLLFFPWVLSPRILFIHHYLPTLPFLCLLIIWSLFDIKKSNPKIGKFLITGYSLLTIILFLFFYPLNTALPLPNHLLKFWFWLPSWR